MNCSDFLPSTSASGYHFLTLFDAAFLKNGSGLPHIDVSISLNQHSSGAARAIQSLPHQLFLALERISSATGHGCQECLRAVDHLRDTAVSSSSRPLTSSAEAYFNFLGDVWTQVSSDVEKRPTLKTDLLLVQCNLASVSQ